VCFSFTIFAIATRFFALLLKKLQDLIVSFTSSTSAHAKLSISGYFSNNAGVIILTLLSVH